ncbi:MAG TPA: branched-chain amino acid ABC transporter permease [bacterium]|nr:branched-chain amino acid ABC transporter permease [bacterium]
MTHERGWRQAIVTGLVWGLAAVFVSLVGLVEAIQQRQIITGVIAGGHAMLLLVGVGAGVQAAHRLGARGASRALAGAALAGAIAGTLVAVLIALSTVVNMRPILVGASPTLFEILSLGVGVLALPWIVIIGILAASSGAALTLLPPTARRLTVTGAATVLMVGLFQELVQLMLQSERVARVRDLIFTIDGLPPRGALIVLAVALGISAAWGQQRPRMRRKIADLAPGQRRIVQAVGLVAGIALLLVMPLLAGPFLSQVFVLVGLYTLMGLGLNLEVGFAGLLDLGFAAFFAIGAFTVALLTTEGPLAIASVSWWTATLIAVVVSLIAGVFFGLPVLGIRGDYLAIATLGFGEIIRLMVLSDFLRPWLGGSQGILAIPKPVLFGYELRGPEQLFYLTLGASAIIAFVAARLRDSRLGRAWMAMREDEDVAQAMGINLINVKLLAYAIGAAFAGVGGAIFAVMVSSVFPHSFTVLLSINVLALIIVGGMGSLPGVVVGSLALVGLPELLREFSDFRFLVYGAVLMLMMIMRPEGLWPAAAIRRELHEEVERVPEGEMITKVEEAGT